MNGGRERTLRGALIFDMEGSEKSPDVTSTASETRKVSLGFQIAQKRSKFNNDFFLNLDS